MRIPTNLARKRYQRQSNTKMAPFFDVKAALAGIAYTEDVVKYTEILITPEVVLQSTFSCFLLQLLGQNKVSWAGRPSARTRFCCLVLTQCRRGLNLPTSIKISNFLFCVTRSLFSGMVTYYYMHFTIYIHTVHIFSASTLKSKFSI